MRDRLGGLQGRGRFVVRFSLGLCLLFFPGGTADVAVVVSELTGFPGRTGAGTCVPADRAGMGLR